MVEKKAKASEKKTKAPAKKAPARKAPAKKAAGKKPAAKKAKTPKTSENTKASVRDYSLLIKPIISEKVGTLGGPQGGGVAFRVSMDATKTDIRAAVERIFGVEVAKVRTCSYLGKVKRTARSVGRRDSYKKAYVILKPGHSIDLVEGV
jgi:large subunit ribosomal protein L23